MPLLMVFHPLPLPFPLSFLILPTKFRSLIPLVPSRPHILYFLLQFLNLPSLAFLVYDIRSLYIFSIFLPPPPDLLEFFQHRLQHLRYYPFLYFFMSTSHLWHIPDQTFPSHSALLTHHIPHSTTLPLLYLPLFVVQCLTVYIFSFPHHCFYFSIPFFHPSC